MSADAHKDTFIDQPRNKACLSSGLFSKAPLLSTLQSPINFFIFPYNPHPFFLTLCAKPMWDSPVLLLAFSCVDLPRLQGQGVVVLSPGLSTSLGLGPLGGCRCACASLCFPCKSTKECKSLAKGKWGDNKSTQNSGAFIALGGAPTIKLCNRVLSLGAKIALPMQVLVLFCILHAIRSECGEMTKECKNRG